MGERGILPGILVGLLVGTAGSLIASLFSASRPWLIVVGALSALLAAILTARVWSAHRRPPKDFDAMNRALHRAARSAASILSVERHELGFHIYRLLRRRLVRVARVRDSSTPPTPVSQEFEVGEGVVGTCAEREEAFTLDLTDPRYQTVNADTWQELPAHLTTRMSYERFVATTHHFKAIVAVPIVHNVRLVGVLSANLDRDSKAPPSEFFGARIRAVLRDEAEAVAPLL